MADFLLELLCEEIPARMQKGARGELKKLFRRELDAVGVSPETIIVWSTPRRLALIARGLPLETQAVREEAKGPPVGAPDQAVDGFCRKNGVTRDQLEEREVKGRATWFAVKDVPGQAVGDLLAAAISTIVRDFSWPKSMRWGETSISSESLKWVRPLTGIVALLDGEVVPVVMEGVASGRETVGHRFHSNGPITIAGADDYAPALKAAHVIVDHEEREAIVREGAQKAAQDAGLVLVEDEGLVIENAGLTEWPVPLLGRFDDEFLEVPPEVIQLTARVNQKYFVCNDANGKLANAFVCTANLKSSAPDVVVDGNRKVIAARLSDARFFWELDQKTTLAEHATKLERITFHEKLGTVADKVDRVAKLASWLVFDAKEPNGDHQLTRQAAELCKADLVTEMVGEFPELQGLMGAYYAEKETLPQEVSDAIRDHYRPAGQGDDVPTAPTSVAVAVADRLDTLLSFFKVGILPTGSKDPFALRRAALGYLRLIQTNALKLDLKEVVHAWESRPFDELAEKLGEFLMDRLGVQLRDEGVRHDFIAASRDWSGVIDTRLDRVEARARALSAFLQDENGSNLLAGYKRAANILKKEEWDGAENRLDGKSVSYSPEPDEKALIDALDAAQPKAAAAIAAEDFEGAMAALASLRNAVDAFFDTVVVNAPEADKRESRLALLARFRDAVHKVADFSRIEG